MASTPDAHGHGKVGGQRALRRSRHSQHSRSRSSQEAKHLDFQQAMKDFKHMFPTMDSEVIEAVLRANNGAVDASIDQLLTMNVDLTSTDTSSTGSSFGDQNSSVPKHIDPPPPFMAKHPGPPPPYESPDSSSSSDDDDSLIPESLRNMRIRDKNVPAQKLEIQRTISVPTSTKKVVYKHWNPPLIGKLPDDFLRITEPRRPVIRPAMNGSETTASKRGPRTPLRTTISPSTEEKNSPMWQINRNRRIIQEKIAKNAERRRDAPSHFDADTARYLEDERLALMLQNQEFLEELKRNAEFMNTLEEDVKDEERPSGEPLAQASKKPDYEEEEVGYGEDNLGELGAFPHTKVTPQSDAEFKTQLNNMGVSSRKKFAVLASKFFSRRRRSKKPMTRQLLKDSSAPSTINLLDDNDDEDIEDDRQESKFNEKPFIEPLPGSLSAVPRTKTVQKSPYHPEPIVFYQDDDNFHDMV